MLKRFFVSMLGSLAAIWLTFMLLFLLAIVSVVGVVASAFSSSTPSVDVKDGTILTLNLDSEIDERESTPRLSAMLQGAEIPTSLETLLKALRAASTDDKVKGLFIECDGASAGLATRYELVEAIKELKANGKWVIAYGDGVTQGDYYVASQADEFFINPEGSIQLTGLQAQVMFFTGLLEKLGIEMQVTKVGTYKSAVEPYILKHISEPNKEQMECYMGSIWNTIASTIASARNLTVADVNACVDSLCVYDDAQYFLEARLCDELKYWPEMEQYLMEKVGVDSRDDLNMVSCLDYAASASDPLQKKSKNKIALLYAFGQIYDDGEEGITAGELVPTIMDLIDDDDLQAVLFRVNSPGGSADASEQIWHAINLLKDSGKTVYVSMGDYAASGGYYISCSADKIFAAPTTLTGSIGVFGLMPCAKGLVTDKLGVNVDYVCTNPEAQLPSLFEPFTPRQRQKLQKSVDRIYATFTQHVAEGRHMPLDSVRAIAEGRVWDGLTAKRLGLVDEIGTLGDAIQALADHCGYDDFTVESYPELNSSFWDFLARLDSNIKARIIRSELGDSYPIYREIQRVSHLDPLQMRMESISFE